METTFLPQANLDEVAEAVVERVRARSRMMDAKRAWLYSDRADKSLKQAYKLARKESRKANKRAMNAASQVHTLAFQQWPAVKDLPHVKGLSKFDYEAACIREWRDTVVKAFEAANIDLEEAAALG